jgi:hypothetical protein
MKATPRVGRGIAFISLAEAKASSRGIPLAARTPKKLYFDFFVNFVLSNFK